MTDKNTNHHHIKAKTLIELKDLLEEKPYSKKELMDHFGIHRSSTERYITALKDLGFRVKSEKRFQDREREYSIVRAPRAPRPFQILLAHSALRLLLHHSSGLNRQFLDALESLARQIPEEPLQKMALQSTQSLAPYAASITRVGDASIDLSSNLDRIEQAWLKRRTVSFEYRAPGGDGQWRKHLLDIYFLEISRTNLSMYVVGFEHRNHKAIRTFKVNRMRFVMFASEENAFDPPKDFDPSTYLANAWGVIGGGAGKTQKVILRFAPEAAYRIEEEFNPLMVQQTRDPDSGALTVELEVGVDSSGFPREIFPWIQSWGPRVEVLFPPRLRKRWLREARQVLALYGEMLGSGTASLSVLPYLWAKSGKSDHPTGHPVIAHLLDVAAAAWILLELEPDSTLALFAEDFGLTPEEAKRWVCLLVALHDLGKISPAFQQKWKEGFERLLKHAPEFHWKNGRPPKAPPEDSPHNVITQVTLPALLQNHGISDKAAKKLADAIGCHHGFRASATQLAEAEYAHQKGIGVWNDARKETFDTLVQVLRVQHIPQITDLSMAAFMRLAGLTSFADWIGSSFYPDLKFDGFEHDLNGYFDEALDVARRRLETLGWTCREVLYPQVPDFAEVFGYLMGDASRVFEPRPLQSEVKHLLQDVHEPTLLLIEAAMGEGKTEAALYGFLQLQSQLQHRGLYVALPTMATGNAMFKRTARFLDSQAKDRSVALDLQLLHGNTALNKLYQQLQEASRVQVQPNTHTGPSNPEEKLEHVAARSYFTQKKRALLSEYGVGTVDQALLTVLNVKHQFVRLWGLGNRVVVIDEVHAYDTYTSTLIVSLVRWLKELGSSVILMSATLPRHARKTLLEAYKGTPLTSQEWLDDAPEAYPRISMVSGSQMEIRSFPADQSRAMTIHVQGLTGDLHEMVQLLDLQLADGGCAVCIVNTVDRAQALYDLLSHHERYLFHARFPADQRESIENTVLQKFGNQATIENGQRPVKAVLIATQVVEQSLDLDFDLMVSDLAPIDLLLQRSGRLWRHKRSTRPLMVPQLFVAGLKHETELPDLKTHHWDKVYAPYQLYRTWKVLKGRNTIDVPAEIDPLVQEVYRETEVDWSLSDEAVNTIQQDQKKWQQEADEDFEDARKALIGHVTKKGPLIFNDDTLQTRDEDEAPNGRPVAQTRKGDPSVTVIPLFHLNGEYFLDQAGERPYDRQQPLETFMRAVRLSRVSVIGNPKKRIPSSLEIHNRETGMDQVFRHWEKEPLLQGCVPLVLDAEGKALIGKTEVMLHPELGVVYRKKTP